MHRTITVLLLLAAYVPESPAADCDSATSGDAACTQLEPITIFGRAGTSDQVAGGANEVTAEELAQFQTTDVVRALRRVPGVSLQQEDGWGLRPNISIRGTATDRSSRITLLEDGVLIAPAPYSAPAAYYFPTFGRIRSVEVLKGPAAISEGPYTVGGAINLLSTPIPTDARGSIQGEYGEDDTWRLHGWYGDQGERFGFLAETHQWQSDGYQDIDRSSRPTGLSKEDYLARLAVHSDPSAALDQSLEIKLQASQEESQQSYLGLTDADFARDAQRRYGLSERDEMDTEHRQVSLSWRLRLSGGQALTVTAYDNDFERAWYKTEGIDFDGSPTPESLRLTGWSSVISAINTGSSLGGFSAGELEAILGGADTAPGSIQLRNNAREYYARGIQVRVDHAFRFGAATHEVTAGLRWHKDEEDRLQRNDNFQQLGGKLVLNARGLEGNAGNQIQDAQAWAAFVQDRIEWGAWILTPGLRFEDIELGRTRYFTNGADPASRDPANFRDYQENHESIWLPGLGVLYSISESTRLVGGVHKGFAAPGSSPDSRPEESINYEFGIRQERGPFQWEALAFYNDYSNLVGICTNSSGGGCEPGEVFDGDAVDVPGLEFSLGASFPAGNWEVPIFLAYTWMDAEFQSAFNSEFFGEVSPGDPVPYIPEHQAFASLGLRQGPWSAWLSSSYVDEVCTQAGCGEFERTESAVIFDLALHYELGKAWELYAVAENLADEVHIAGREPYGVMANKPRSFKLGLTFSF